MTALLALFLLAPPADTLVVGILTDPVSLEPHHATDLVSAAVIANVCETLVRFRDQGDRPDAALATTWATVDRRTWTFTLRENVRFHDGAPLDAEAVIANLEHLRKERAFPGQAQRIGPLVVAITLDKPNAALLATLSQPFFALQSPRALGGDAATPVGTGPFRVAASKAGAVELEANPGYWGGPPRMKHVSFRRFATEDVLVSALVGGEVDVTAAVGQDMMPRLRARSDITLDSQTGLNLAFLSVNNERPPFSDRRVRQALARAVDRDSLVSQVLHGHGEPAQNPLPPSLWGYVKRPGKPLLDRAAARRLLAQAGLADGFETTLMAVNSPRPYMPAPLALAARLEEDLAGIGIRVHRKEASSWAEYLDRATRGDYDLAVLGWQADTVDPNDFLSALLASEAIGTTNRSRYKSPAMDSLLKRARMGGDPDERLGVYRDAQDLFQKDMPWVPLYHVAALTAYRRIVRGLARGPTGILRYDKAWKQE